MSGNPKIVVFQLKELIYTVIFVILGILLILLLVSMFLNGGEDEKDTEAAYIPGTYSTSLTIGSMPMEVSVKVDSERIVDIGISPAGDAVETVYPMMQSSMDNIKSQIISSQSLEDIHLASDSQYTYGVLMDAIKSALSKASAQTE